MDILVREVGVDPSDGDCFPHHLSLTSSARLYALVIQGSFTRDNLSQVALLRYT